jgi:hypothetical protein
MIDGLMAIDSITARDGSYYLGDVRPGKYCIEMDGETLPPKYTFEAQKKEVEVAPKIESQELKMVPFEGHITPDSDLVFGSFSTESIAKIGNTYFVENSNIGIRDNS